MSTARPPEAAQRRSPQGVGISIFTARPPEAAQRRSPQGVGISIFTARPPEGAQRRSPQGVGISIFTARPPKTKVPARQRGVTIVELMIAMALGLAVLIGLSAVYVASKQSFRFQETSGRLQEDAAFALESIARDLRMAGFAGCRGVDAITIAGVLTYYPTLSLTAPSPGGISGPNPLATVEPTNASVLVKPLSPNNFLRGFDNVPSAMFAVGSVPVTSATDSLFFSGGSSKTLSVSAAMALADSAIPIASDPFGWGAAPPKVYNMVVSNCTSSSLFAGQVISGGTEIAHGTGVTSANTGGNSANTFPTTPLYGIDAIVMPLEWNFYYVATRAGALTPSLYRIFYDGSDRGNAEEIVSNVESMQLNYGENTANDPVSGVPTMQADIWRTTAAAVTDWSRVVAVRIGLMMVSEDNSANLDVVTAVPTLLGQSYTPPAGASMTRLRKEFSTTVVLRNRIAAR